VQGAFFDRIAADVFHANVPTIGPWDGSNVLRPVPVTHAMPRIVYVAPR
jgi:hypothetical protein